MIEETSVACPYCGANNVVEVDVSVARQQFVVDCDVCCRPMEVKMETRDGEILSLDVTPD